MRRQPGASAPSYGLSPFETAYLPAGLDAPPLPTGAASTNRSDVSSASKPDISIASSQLMLLLLRANVPNAEIFHATTDRELALLAQKHGCELPRHLAHLPSLPPPRAAAPAWDPNAAALEGTALKDRPPRRTRLSLGDAAQVQKPAAPAGAPTGSAPPRPRPEELALSPAQPLPQHATSPSPAAAVSPPVSPSQAKPSHAKPGAASPPDDLISGFAVKERAPSNRRKRRDKEKAKAAPPPAAAEASAPTKGPHTAAAAASAAPEDLFSGQATRERAPSNRRGSKKKGS